MEAKDTVMSDEQMSKFIQFPVEGYTSDRNGLCQAQAEITWKVAWDAAINWARTHQNYTESTNR